MATAWRIWVGTLRHNGLDIAVPAHLQRYDDTNPPPSDGNGLGAILQEWDISTSVSVADAAGNTIPQLKALLLDRVKSAADPIKALWETWEQIDDMGNQAVPGWPA